MPIGARVTCDPNIACGTCDQCLRGRGINLCVRNVAIGIHRDGGFAEMAVIPAHRAIPVPDLHPHHAAFAEPLACTLHGVDLGAPIPGERVIVLGGGVIGLLAVQLARNAGAEVTLVTRHPGKRNLALLVGATYTAATEAEARARLPQGADLVLECGRGRHRRDGPASCPLWRAGRHSWRHAAGRDCSDRALRPALPRNPASAQLHQPVHPSPRRRDADFRPDQRRPPSRVIPLSECRRPSPTQPGRARSRSSSSPTRSGRHAPLAPRRPTASADKASRTRCNRRTRANVPSGSRSARAREPAVQDQRLQHEQDQREDRPDSYHQVQPPIARKQKQAPAIGLPQHPKARKPGDQRRDLGLTAEAAFKLLRTSQAGRALPAPASAAGSPASPSRPRRSSGPRPTHATRARGQVRP